MDSLFNKDVAKIIGESIFFASIQSSLGSCLMSSSFSVINFSKDQNTLQGAADALRQYIIMGAVWAFATVLVLYANHGMVGAFWGLTANVIVIAWLVATYINAFNAAVSRYGLVYPKIF